MPTNNIKADLMTTRDPLLVEQAVADQIDASRIRIALTLTDQISKAFIRAHFGNPTIKEVAAYADLVIDYHADRLDAGSWIDMGKPRLTVQRYVAVLHASFKGDRAQIKALIRSTIWRLWHEAPKHHG